jgi:hypothetical protein
MPNLRWEEETPMRDSRKRGRRCNTRSTFEKSRCNNCNICKADKTLTKIHEKHLKTIVKHMQHPDKILATYA